ncbi:MAG: hypothetical protein GY711_14890 [bacterium]|nr:hypothetical protein [bacterium]
MLYLTGPTTATQTIRRPKWSERDGAWVAPFTFDNLPMDTYEPADGYVPIFGDESALVTTEGKGVITAELQPGWRARIEATDASTGAPLAGIAVLLDGSLVV